MNRNRNSSDASAVVSYGLFTDLPAWDRARVYVCQFLDQHPEIVSVLEIGSGRNPTLAVTDLEQRVHLQYTTNDIDEQELQLADSHFATLPLDLSAGHVKLEKEYDLIFSRMVNEHVKNGRTYYRNIFQMLKPGGYTIHVYSTLYALPFVVNRIVPEWLSDRLLVCFSPRDRERHAKFPAYYSWSRGPSRSMLRGFRSVGFDIVSFHGFFGHGYYRHKLGPLHRLEMLKARALLGWPIPQLTSYAHVVLRRPS